MRISRRPWLFVLLWTVLCALAVSYLLPAATTRPDPECIDMCVRGQVGSYLIGVIVVVWLVVTLIAVAVWSRFGDPNSGRGR